MMTINPGSRAKLEKEKTRNEENVDI